MKKGKRGVALAMSLIAITLTACDDYTYPDADWKDGQIVTIGGHTYEFDEIYKVFENTKTSAQSYFTVAKSILAQAVTPRSEGLLSIINTKMENLHDTWKTNARTNGTSYKEEQEKTFDSEGVEDEDELKEKYISQQQVSDNQSAFESVQVTTDGNSEEYYISKEATETYVKEKAPYHVSHILVKVDAASGGEGYYNGQISSDNAKHITNVVRMLSSGTDFGSVAQLTSDDSSNTQYGELYTSGSSGMVAMQKDTSYVNEFKLGVYAYDTFLNNKTNNNSDAGANAKTDDIKTSLRVPGATDSTGKTIGEQKTIDSLESTLIGNNEAFGIPLSVCFEMNAVADWESNPEDGSTIKTENNKTISARQYPRNVLFNNYFNYHGVSFIYDDSDEYDATFLAEANAVMKAKGNAYQFTSIDDFKDKASSYKMSYKLKEYEYVKGQLDNVNDSSFVDYDGTLVNYTSTKSGSTNKNTLNNTITGKKVLANNGDPIIIARAGTSGDSGYQGIHFITVNNDPFTSDANGDYTETYKYYRCNVPSTSKTENSYSSDYESHPSFINFVYADNNSTTTYNARRETVENVIKSSLDSEDIALWQYNLKQFKEKYGVDFLDTYLSKYKAVINKYITLTTQSSDDSANETLDSSWETYVNQLVMQTDLTEDRLVPTYSLASFEAGYYDETMEEICYVG